MTNPEISYFQPVAVTESREYKHAMGDWLGAVGELIEAMGRPKFAADTPVAVIAEAIREAAKRLVPASAPEVAPWPITDAMIDAVAPYCQAKSRDLAHTALAAARNAAPAKQAPAVGAEARVRAALAELVALKDMKDRLQRLHESGCGTDYTEYHRRKPAAWEAARAALADTPQAREPQPAEFCWLVELFLGDGTGNSLGWYHTGFTDIGGNSRSTQDPLKAKRYSTWREANLASVKLGHTLQGTWRAVQHGFVSHVPVHSTGGEA